MTKTFSKWMIALATVALALSFTACDDDDEESSESSIYEDGYFRFTYQDSSSECYNIFYFDPSVNYFYYYTSSSDSADYDSTSATSVFRGSYTGTFNAWTTSSIVLTVEYSNDDSVSTGSTMTLTVSDSSSTYKNADHLAFVYGGNKYKCTGHNIIYAG